MSFKKFNVYKLISFVFLWQVTLLVFLFMMTFAVLIWIGMEENPIDSSTVARVWTSRKYFPFNFVVFLEYYLFKFLIVREKVMVEIMFTILFIFSKSIAWILKKDNENFLLEFLCVLLCLSLLLKLWSIDCLSYSGVCRSFCFCNIIVRWSISVLW